jgi:hypothetical protein
MTFVTPWYALLGLAAVVPLAVAFQRLRAAAALREELGLPAPPLGRQLVRPLAVASIFALVAAAAAQPAVRTEQHRTARTDAEIFIAIDNSRSMLASRGLTGAPRYLRALRFTRRVHQAFRQVPTGIASLTNRVLPYVFPTTSDAALDEVLRHGYGIERPPPEVTSGEEVSTFDALDDVAHHDFYGRHVKKRVLLVLSDAETLPFRIRRVLADLERVGIKTLVVRFWRPDERVFRLDNRPERYRPSAAHELDILRSRGWSAYDESQFAAVRQVVAQTVGRGPVHTVALERLDRPVGPYVAALALIPLLVLLWPLLVLRRAPGPAERSSAGPVRATAAAAVTSAE